MIAADAHVQDPPVGVWYSIIVFAGGRAEHSILRFRAESIPAPGSAVDVIVPVSVFGVIPSMHPPLQRRCRVSWPPGDGWC